MATIRIDAIQKISLPGENSQGFMFDLSDLPPLHDASIVDQTYSIGFRWLQTKDFGYGSPNYVTLAYFQFINGTWERYEGDTVTPQKYGWYGVVTTAHVRPTSNKLAFVVRYSDFDQTIGTNKSPHLNVNYTPVEVVTVLDKVEDTKENEQLIIAWSSDNIQAKYEFEYTNDGVMKTNTGTIAKNIMFDRYQLKPGELTYRIRINNGYFWSSWASGKINILEYPIHLTLEPNKIAQNKDKPIVVMWSTSDTQTQFELLYSGSVSGKITGTTAKTHTFPAGTFSNGVVRLTLRVFNGYVWTEKVAEFMAYGAPPNPTLTTLASYNTAIPNFTWTATEQVSYRVQVLNESTIVLDSGEIYSSNKSHRFTNVLENNTTYTVRLRIRNQYEIESEWVSKTFTVAFTELQKANFDIFANDRLGTIMFNIYNAAGQSNYKHCEVLRREYGQVEWVKIASDLGLTATYTDYTCRSGVLYEYKVRATGTSGGYTDSEIGLKEVSLRNTMLSDTTNFNDYVVLVHNPKKARAFAKETHVMQYSGVTMPRFEFGDSKYIGMSVDFKMDEKTLDKLTDLYYSNNILMLRDNRGKKLFGYITGDISATDAEFNKYDVSFKFTETEYKEGVLV